MLEKMVHTRIVLHRQFFPNAAMWSNSLVELLCTECCRNSWRGVETVDWNRSPAIVMDLCTLQISRRGRRKVLFVGAFLVVAGDSETSSDLQPWKADSDTEIDLLVTGVLVERCRRNVAGEGE